jgi:uncharacterized protein
MNSLFEIWEWYLAGPLIGLFVPLMLIIGNKMFGISSAFLHICVLVLPKKKFEKFKYNWKENSWKFYFVIGIGLGAFIASTFLSDEPVRFLPEDYYTLSGYFQLLLGGILVGFGTRYANGCTSGHSITGLATLQLASLKATIAFFVGGLIYTWSAYFL